MKSLFLIPLLVLGALPVQADSQRGYSNQCFKEVYREEYIPGTKNDPGYINSWIENVEVPCSHTTRTTPRRVQPVPEPIREEENSCVEGSILGGVLGAAGGAAASRGDGRWIGVPVGIVAGSMIGCQIDGG